MPRELISKYQLSGIDERDRGFSRQVYLEFDHGQYLASLEYEETFVKTGLLNDESSALKELIRNLQHMGYTCLQTQRSFAGEIYLGTQEACVEYPDPEHSEQLAETDGVLGWMRRLLGIS